jgi:hypothetical protein
MAVNAETYFFVCHSVTTMQENYQAGNAEVTARNGTRMKTNPNLFATPGAEACLPGKCNDRRLAGRSDIIIGLLFGLPWERISHILREMLDLRSSEQFLLKSEE